MKVSKLTKEKISNATRGDKNPFYGKKHSEESRKIMKEKRKNQVFSKETLIKKRNSMMGKNKGEKSWNWQGGITPINKKIWQSVEMKVWREIVFERDNYICQKTKIKGIELHPHHILNFSSHPELRFDINNGITLSKKSHKEFHKIYGQRNNTREQLLEFLSIK